METKLYKISTLFARHNKLPTYFVAIVLKETPKAVYLHGRGTLETIRLGRCMICGRRLTHPVSVELGIGPECGQHWHDWDRIGGYTTKNIERLKGAVLQINVDSWVPRSVIREILPSSEKVKYPGNHPMHQEIKEQPGTKFVTLNERKQLEITFPFDLETVEQVKTLVQRSYISQRKCWLAAFSPHNLKELKAWGFSFDPKVVGYYREKYPTDLNTPDPKPKDIIIPPLKGGELFEFQKQGVSFIHHKNGNALIADEMGLGKTVQALVYLQLNPTKRPVVIVVPASLKYNWLVEAEKWLEKPAVQVLSGTSVQSVKQSDIIIINYDILPAWVDALKAIQPKVLITDECHYYKNNKSKRTKAVKKLAKGIPHVIALSGTPIVNRPIEIYNALKLIDPTFTLNFFSYAKRYCDAKHNGFGWDFNGASNTEELHKRLTDTIMIRRKKADVLKDLPDKLYSHLPMEMDNLEEYQRAEADFIEFVKETKGAQAAVKASGAQTLVEIEGLKQLAVQGKLKQAISWIHDFLNTGEKLVVFAVHKFVIDALMNEFKEQAVKIDGSVSSIERQATVEKFQTDESTRLFVGNIKAAGVGITLTASSNVAILELPWTPGDLSQAEDRCHRIGQKDSVTVYFLLAMNTIEGKIATLLSNKRKVLDQVLDGKQAEDLNVYQELLEGYTIT